MANTINDGIQGSFAYYPSAGTDLDDVGFDVVWDNVLKRIRFHKTVTQSGNADRIWHIFMASDLAATIPGALYVRSRGTVNSPTSVQNGDELGKFDWMGKVSGTSQFAYGASVKGVVDNTPGANSLSTKVVISTSNGTSFAERFTVAGSGDVILSSSTDATSTTTGALQVAGGAGIGGSLYVGGNVNVVGEITAYFSDARLKQDIQPISNAIDKIKAINGYTYKSNDLASELGVSNKDGQIGLLAQEVEVVMPELVTQSALEGYKTIKYDKLVSVLVNAVKEQQQMIEDLRNIIKTKLA